MKRFLTTTLMALGLAAAAADAQQAVGAAPIPVDTPGFEPLVRPVLEIRPAAGAIRIDGDLDDDGWVDAAVATGFSEFQPRSGVPARTPTEAFLTYDERNLYIAFRVTDDPTSLRVTSRDRDEVWSDDWVIAVFDTYGDNSWAYMIGANPIGVQLDARFSNNSGDDPSFDVVYESAGRITATGYQVELAIPFASLRFPDADDQQWRLQLVRSHPRETRRQYSWAALSMDESCILCQSGTLIGLTGVRPGGQLELLPALVAGYGGSLTTGSDPASFAFADPSAELSLGVRYPFRSGWTAEATFNPDFSQIESDASQIDVNTTFALFFPERRPFFQEGSDLFQTWIDAIYTRSINSPIAAGKVIGRRGNLAMGYIGAVDDASPVIIPLEEASVVTQNGRSVSNVFRGRMMFGSGSSLGGLLTDRRFTSGGGSGSNFGLDALIRLGQRWQIEAQVVGSHTREPDAAGPTEGLEDVTFGDGLTAAFDGETFLGRATYLSLERSARGWNFDLDYWDATPTYRADNGFQGQNDFRRVAMFNGYGIYPDEGVVDQVFIGTRVSETWNFDGAMKTRFAGAFFETRMKGPSYVNMELAWNEERFAGRLFEDMIGGGVGVGSNFGDALSVNIGYRRGESIYRDRTDPRPGHRQSAYASATIKPLRNLVISPSMNWVRMDDLLGEELFAGYIARTRVNYQLTRRLVVRAVTEWDDFSGQLALEPMLLYRLNPLSVLYIGSSHGYRDFDDPSTFGRTRQQYFVKLQYLFRP